MSAKKLIVLPSGNKWGLKSEGESSFYFMSEKIDEVLENGRKLAKERDTWLVIHPFDSNQNTQMGLGA